MNYVAALSELGRTDLSTAGGKGANLGELVRAGLPVPDGFVVTTTAYSAAADAVEPRIGERVGAAGGGGESLRGQIETAPLPAGLATQIAAAYTALGAGPVAVRSSATAEDLPGAAFAGQQDTYLNIVGEDALVDAVRRCWGSLWTDRAIAYRQRLGIDSGEVAIAVVVQRLVDADAAGVMFTADPVTGDRETITVDASAGLGEAVVSGQVTPDHYRLDHGGRVREFTRGRREVVIHAAAGGGVAYTSDGSGPESTLPEAALAELARLGTRVAGLFGRPQDIEWAWAHGQVTLLQARPMTALPPPPVRLGRAQRTLGAILLELFPVRPYPIDMSTWVPHGPVGLMAGITRFYGIRGAFENLLTEPDGVVYALVPQKPRPTADLLRAPARLASRARRYDPARWTGDPRFIDYRARVRELAGPDLTGLSWGELVARPRRTLSLIDPIAALRIDYLPPAGVALGRLLVTLTLLGRRGQLRDLMATTPTRTRDANHALEALAAGVRTDPALAAAVTTGDTRNLSGFPEFAAELASFLAEYGHRETTSAILVTQPTWGDDTATVLGLITMLAADPPQSDDTDQALAWLLAHPWLRHPCLRAHVLRRVERARAGAAFREDSHFAFTELLPALRRTLLEIGARLTEAGLLAEPTEMYHLRLEELETLTDPHTLPENDGRRLRRRVATRSARRGELAGVRLIDPQALYPPARHGDALVAGTPAGGGEVTGPVRIIHGPEEFPQLHIGDVLVCPYTNPSWTPLFARAAAVVVDSGGSASHAAIVAREYGIAAVMGTGTGTSTLGEGQRVTVNGTTGRITAASVEASKR